MNRTLRQFLAYCLTVSLIVPSLGLAENSQATADNSLTPEQYKALSQDAQTLYWARLDHEMPWMSEFALRGSKDDFPLSKVDQSSPLIDQDPFFMRSQAWEKGKDSCGADICARKDGGDLVLSFANQPSALRIKQKLGVVLETEDYVLLSADDTGLFQAKVPGDGNPGEGMFFIAKRDVPAFAARQAPVPVFHVPLPDAGWTGPNPKAFELASTREVVVFNHEGFGLPIDVSDLHLLEKVQRDNLLVGVTWSFIEGQVAPNGVALPKPGITLGFGLFLSGALPDTSRRTGGLSLDRFRQMAGAIGGSLIPQANARDESDSMSDVNALVDQRAKDAENKDGGWKKWIVPGVLWGGRVALAYLAYDHVDWDKLIPEDMTHRISTVVQMMGGVAVAAVALRFSLHKALFDKKYPKSPDQTALDRLTNEHKAMLDEFTHASYFSLAAIPQGIRHFLEFWKDRFFPANKTVHTAWEATMGFQMRQNSKLAMNWKTWWLGVWVYGFSDASAVFMDLLIFAPFLAQHLGWEWTGTAMAAWASSEVFRNFLGYFQAGAHSYSADVKMIHLKSAEKIAKRQMDLSGLDPENPKNHDKMEELVEKELEKRYKILGLPSQDEFLYDPNTTLQYAMGKAGFSFPDMKNLSDANKEELQKTTFILGRRHWGLAKPALQLALRNAKAMHEKSNTLTGELTVNLLESALGKRSVTKNVLGRLSSLVTREGREKMDEAICEDLGEYLAETQTPNPGGALASTFRGWYKYLVTDAAKEVRDQRMVLFLMSTIGNPEAVMKFLPKSWIDRADGSREVAYAAAELFHRSFQALLQKRPELGSTPDEWMAKYSARATQILEEGAVKPKDAFESQVKLSAVVQRLKAEDDRRDAILNYQPPAEPGYAKKQWSSARAEAERLWTAAAMDQHVSVEWNGMARTFAERSEGEVDQNSWINSYRYRMLVAREFAKQVQLQVDDPRNSEYVRVVIGAAAMETEKQLNQENEKAYMAKLSEEDRRFYEAKLFTSHFINAYVDRSVHSDDYLDAASPQYPGRGQAVRRKIVGWWGEKNISRVVRFFEAGFRNEETAYQPGRFAWFERNVPFLPDMYLNFWRNARTLPYMLTLSYATAYWIWQIHSPYALFLISGVTAFIHPTLVEFNNRLMRNYGIDPMANAANKATYAFTHGALTNVEPVVLEYYADPITEAYRKHVTQPIADGVDECVKALTGH